MRPASPMRPASLNRHRPKSPGRVWLGRLCRVAVSLTAVALLASAAWAAAPEFPTTGAGTGWASAVYATATPPRLPPEFEDVDEGSVHAESIETVARLGITTGTSATTFSPAQTVTRAQLATFMARTWEAAGQECPSSGVVYFTDLAAGSTHATGIDCMSALGVTTGTSATTFSPAQTVTRAQMATFMARMWAEAGQECPSSGALSFTDVAAGSTHAASINCISALRITTGTSATTFSPSQTVTRAQMATFLTRFYSALTTATT